MPGERWPVIEPGCAPGPSDR